MLLEVGRIGADDGLHLVDELFHPALAVAAAL
jgi:hypothetical protein